MPADEVCRRPWPPARRRAKSLVAVADRFTAPFSVRGPRARPALARAHPDRCHELGLGGGREPAARTRRCGVPTAAWPH